MLASLDKLLRRGSPTSIEDGQTPRASRLNQPTQTHGVVPARTADTCVNSAASSSALLNLPQELRLKILGEVSPKAQLSAASSCRKLLRDFVAYAAPSFRAVPLLGSDIQNANKLFGLVAAASAGNGWTSTQPLVLKVDFPHSFWRKPTKKAPFLKAVGFLPGGRRVWGVDVSHSLWAWDILQPERPHLLLDMRRCNDGEMSPTNGSNIMPADDRYLRAVVKDGVRIWDLAGQRPQTWLVPWEERALDLVPALQRVVVNAGAQRVRLRSIMGAAEEPLDFIVPQGHAIRGPRVSRDARFLFVPTDNAVFVWTLGAPHTAPNELRHAGQALKNKNVNFSEDGTAALCFSGEVNSTMTVWNLNGSQPLLVGALSLGAATVSPQVFSQKGKQFVSFWIGNLPHIWMPERRCETQFVVPLLLADEGAKPREIAAYGIFDQGRKAWTMPVQEGNELLDITYFELNLRARPLQVDPINHPGGTHAEQNWEVGFEPPFGRRYRMGGLYAIDELPGQAHFRRKKDWSFPHELPWNFMTVRSNPDATLNLARGGFQNNRMEGHVWRTPSTR